VRQRYGGYESRVYSIQAKRIPTCNARYYDPETGKFLTVDPIKDGMNWYSYANNNPWKYTDPTGNKPLSVNKKSIDRKDYLRKAREVGNRFIQTHKRESARVGDIVRKEKKRKADRSTLRKAGDFLDSITMRYMFPSSKPKLPKPTEEYNIKNIIPLLAEDLKDFPSSEYSEEARIVRSGWTFKKHGIESKAGKLHSNAKKPAPFEFTVGNTHIAISSVVPEPRPALEFTVGVEVDGKTHSALYFLTISEQDEIVISSRSEAGDVYFKEMDYWFKKRPIYRKHPEIYTFLSK